MTSSVIGGAPPSLSSAPEESLVRVSDRNHRHASSEKLSFAVLGGGVALYLGLCYQLLHAELLATGTLTFPLDDTYITLALARNFAFHGAWGLGNASFQSTTSTPGYLLLLAGAYRLFGVHDWLPIAISALFGVVAIFALHQLLRAENIVIQAGAILAVVLFSPLYVIGILGIEHTLHLALCFAFLALFLPVYAERKFPNWSLLLVTMLMTSVRYEGLFFAAAAGLLLLFQKRIRDAFVVGAAAALPVITYGIISVLHGCYWLPHSVSMKGFSGTGIARMPLDIAIHFGIRALRAPYLSCLLLLIVLLMGIPAVWSDLRRRASLAICAVATVLHFALAEVGWVYRYEAYLVAVSIAAIATAVAVVPFRQLKLRWSVPATAVMAAALFFCAQRTREATVTIPLRSLAIYCQQIQMARLLRQFGPDTTVAANDIGAISYFSNVNTLDLAGLGDKEVFWLKRRGDYTTAAMANLAEQRHVKFAIVYDTWFSDVPQAMTTGPTLPASWIRVQRWVTPNGIFLGGGIVSFYALNPADASTLSRALAEFDATALPPVDHVVVN